MSKMQSMGTPVLPSYFQFVPKSEHSPCHSMSESSIQSHPTAHHKHHGSWNQFLDMRHITQAPLPALSVQRSAQGMNSNHSSIRMSKLPCDTTQDDLLTFLQRFGPLSSIDFHSNTDRRFSATVKFHTVAQASLAAQELDGEWWRSRKMSVQHVRPSIGCCNSERSISSKGSDSDSSRGQRTSGKSDSVSGPLVVNGARGLPYHKRRKRDDDSASLEDESGAEEACPCDHQSECLVPGSSTG